MKGTCQFCETERDFPNMSDVVIINKKKIQYIPSYNCSKCGKANYPTFYNDIAKEIQNISKKQALRYTIALNIPFLILGIIINFFM